MLLTDMKLLKDTVGKISMMEFRKNPGDVINQVQMGKTFIITRSGKSVATLAPLEPTALELGTEVRRRGLIGDDE